MGGTLIALALLAGGCGKDDASEDQPAPASDTKATTPAEGESKPAEKPKPKPDGTEIVVGDSEFGEMLFDKNRQAIYVFELDGNGPSQCYGECATAWPPVLTKGDPVAGKGTDQRLLGTTKRDDGGLQVTYDGQPLYFYAHEEPGEVLCHNVDLNGGLWWVVGPDGEPLP